MISIVRRASRPLAFLAVVAAASWTPARGDVVDAAYADPDNYKFELLHMPDFDQVRAAASGVFGLPNDGSMYCMPTATTNMYVYAAIHGFPELLAGPLAGAPATYGSYQSQSLYNQVGSQILVTGAFLMSTDPNDGTEGSAWWSGTANQLGYKFAVVKYSKDDGWAPRAHTIANQAVNGHLVSYLYGRYWEKGGYPFCKARERDGGHAVTLTKALAGGGYRLLWNRNPAPVPPEGNKTTQAPFKQTKHVVFDECVIADGDSYVMSSLNKDPAKKMVRYIDSFLAVHPKFGLTFSKAPKPKIKIKKPYPKLDFPDPPEIELASPDQTGILDAQFDPDHTGIYLLTVGLQDPTLHHLEIHTGKSEPIAVLPGAKRICVGRTRELYALTDTGIQVLKPWQPEVLAAAVQLPFPCDGVTYDDGRDELVLLSTAQAMLVRYPEEVSGPPRFAVLPPAQIAGADSRLVAHPSDGTVWLLAPGSKTILSVQASIPGIPPVVTAVTLPELNTPTSIEIDDDGRLFVSDGGHLLELVQQGAGWTVLQNSAWAPFLYDDVFQVTRSRTNFDPATMSGPAWRNVTPEEVAAEADPSVPDCDVQAVDVEYGTGKAGSLGVPKLKGGFALELGSVATIEIQNALPGAFPFLMAGLTKTSLAFDGGTLLVVPDLFLKLPLPIRPDGTLSITGPVPADGNLCGLTLYHQVLFVDPGASGFYHASLTNGLARTFGS